MIDKSRYTHYATFYGVPCYWNENTQELDGRNMICELLLSAMVWIESNFPSNEYGFPIKITGEI